MTAVNDLDEVAAFALSISNPPLSSKHKDYLRDIQWHLIDLRVVKFCVMKCQRVRPPPRHETRQSRLRSMSLSILMSSVVTKLMATPFRPNRPPRPIRWM